jgi:DNA-binding CsgD family transcriptional regulator
MSDVSLPVVDTTDTKELDNKVNDLLGRGLSVRQIIQQFDISLVDIQRATASPATEEDSSDDIVISVGDDSKVPVRKSKSTVKDLIKEGLDLEEIISETGAQRETIVSVLQYFAKDYKGVSLQVSIGSLKNLGVNHELIPIILGIDSSLVEAHGSGKGAPVANGIITNGSTQNQLQPALLSSAKMESDVRNMIKNGLSTKKIMDTFGISYEKLAAIKKRSDSPALLSINNQRVEGALAPNSSAFSKPNQEPSVSVDIAVPPSEPGNPHEKRPTVEQQEDGANSVVNDNASKIVRLAKLNYTLPEIAKEVGMTQGEIIIIAGSQKVFIPYSEKLKTDLNTVAKLAVEDGLSLNQIIDATKLSKFTLQNTLTHIIKCDGRGAEIFRKLLEDDKKPISVVEGKGVAPEAASKPKPALPKPQPKPLVYSGSIRVGDTVKVLSESEISFRDGVKWLSGRTVTVESILDNVAMVSLTYKGSRSFEIMRLGELSKPRVGHGFAIGERISFYEKGFSYTGTVKTAPLDLPDASESQYGISVDGNDDRLKVASELTALPSENNQ